MALITKIETLVPQHRYSQNALADWMVDYINPDEKHRRLLKLVYHQSAVHHRHSVLTDFGGVADLYASQKTSIADRMIRYQKEAKSIALDLCSKMTSKEKNKITHVIYVSCTGMSAPGLDIEIIKYLQLKPTTNRLNITFMGCYAVITALKQANAICKADPNAHVLIVSVELCTLHLQNTQSYDAITSGGLFADGAAMMLVENGTGDGLEIEGDFSYLQPESEDQMSWDVSDTGFLMGLSNEVPKTITEMIRHTPLIDENTLWAVHPGGRRILDSFVRANGLDKEAISWSYDVLSRYGNMSSATICFVLKQLLKSNPKPNQSVRAVAFGPGLVLEGLQLRVKQ